MVHNKLRFQMITILLLVFIAVILIPSFNSSTTALANSAEPIRTNSGSGIVFKQHEHIQIQKEVLDIQINDNVTANIRASYIMKKYIIGNF